MPKPIRRNSISSIVVTILVIGVLFALRQMGYWPPSDTPTNDAPGKNAPADLDTLPAPEEGEYEVVRVVDGDTFIVWSVDADGQRDQVRVRLLGIDTPETVKEDTAVQAWGPEASEFTKKFLAGGHVRLQFDRRKYDQYERLLAYAFVGDEMLNEELVRAGLARVRYYEGDAQTMSRRLNQAQDQARQAQRGIWSGS